MRLQFSAGHQITNTGNKARGWRSSAPVCHCLLRSTILQVQWGLSVPYLISGVRNEHPKDAMAWEDAGKSKDGLGFYDKFVAADAAKAPEVLQACPEGPRVPNHDSELYRREFHTYKPMIKVRLCERGHVQLRCRGFCSF